MINSIGLFVGVFIFALSTSTYAGIKVADNLELGALFMADYERIDGIHSDDTERDEISLRRAKLKIKYKHNDNWRTKVQFSYDERAEELELNELKLTYKGWSFADLSVGKMKEPFGLEYSTSSRHILTMERSLVTEAVTARRNPGLKLSNAQKKLTWSLGAYEIGEWEDSDKLFSLTGRMTYAPIIKDDSVLHFGFSGSWREGSAKEYRVKQSAGVYSGDEILKGPKILADRIFNYGVEALWINGAMSLQAEAYSQDIKVMPASDIADSTYFGYYLLASYAITGETRRYKNGEVSSISRKKGGAWELTARVGAFDASTKTEGSKVDDLTLGLNYYLNKRARLMLNYTLTDFEAPSEFVEDDGSAAALRAQYVF